MAQPPSLKRIAEEGLEDAEEWFRNGFLPQINPFLRDTVNLLSGQVDALNLAAEEREITFTTGASVAIDTAPFPLLLTPQKKQSPQNLVITNCAVDGVAPVGAAQAVWDRTSDGKVRIRLITGLDASTAYKMRIRWD